MTFLPFGFGAGNSGFVAKERNVPFGTLPPQAMSSKNFRYVYDEFRYIQGMASGGGAAAGTSAGVNVLFTGNRHGVLYEQVNIGTLTVFLPVLAATGLDIGFDQASSEGCEILFGAQTGAIDRGRLAYQPSVDKTLGNFFARLQFSIADASGVDQLFFGFRLNQAYQATFSNYTDYAAIGWSGKTAATQTIYELYKGGTGSAVATEVATPKTWADGATHTLGVRVSGGGKVVWFVDDHPAAPTTTFGFTTTNVLFPFFRYVNQAGGNAGSIILTGLEVGFEPEVGA